MIYEEASYKDGLVNKKLNNDEINVMHYLLKRNTSIKIINPQNSKIIETKVLKNANYPKIFNVVISKKISEILELDTDNPYVEIVELKKNKKFIAKEADMFEEEKKVAATAPVEKIKMNDLTKSDSSIKKLSNKKTSFILVICDFYYQDSANNLKTELTKKTKFNNFAVKKINNNKYRLLIGPFENFNALKSTYISLNNLGFTDLNIYKE